MHRLRSRRIFVLGAVGLAAAPLRARADNIVILDPTQTVLMEHQDRMTRLKRIARELQITPEPEFHETVVPADRMPANFHVDTPVLRVVFAEKSFFDTAAWRLRPESGVILDAMAAVLRGDSPDTAVFVAGHTDSRGPEPYNYDLSVNRANTVAQALYSRNVGAIALWRVGFGESVPLYPNDTDAHMGYNRRVEFLFAARTDPVLDVLKRQLDRVCVAPDPQASERCKRTIELRPSFEAVQLTARVKTLDAPAPPRSIATPGALRSLDNPGRQQVASLSSGLREAPLAVRKLSIDLRAQKTSIGLPTS